MWINNKAAEDTEKWQPSGSPEQKNNTKMDPGTDVENGLEDTGRGKGKLG